MDKDCSIVQDLLPLYAENMVREETGEFVAAHLAQCAACRAELDALKADVGAKQASAQPLRALKKQLYRRRLTAVLLAVTLALTLAAAGFAYLTAPQYLAYDETEWALYSPGAAAGGQLTSVQPAGAYIGVNLLTAVSGTEVTSMTDPDSGKSIYFITAWRTPLDEWSGAFDSTSAVSSAQESGGRVRHEADGLQSALRAAESAHTLFTFDAEDCEAVYYSPNSGQEDVLLWGSRSGGVVSLPRIALGYYVLLSFVLFIALSISFFLFRRKNAGKILGHLALIPACYLIGHLLVKGFAVASYHMQRDFSLIILAAALLYAALLLTESLLRQKRFD